MNKSLVLKNIGAFVVTLMVMVMPMLVFAAPTSTVSNTNNSGNPAPGPGGDVAETYWGSTGYINAQDSGTPDATVYGIIRTTMQYLLAILGFIAIIGFVIAGILYLTAAGRDDQIKQAKTAMTYSIMGVIVALVGFVIVNAVDTWLRAGINEGI